MFGKSILVIVAALAVVSFSQECSEDTTLDSWPILSSMNCSMSIFDAYNNSECFFTRSDADTVILDFSNKLFLKGDIENLTTPLNCIIDVLSNEVSKFEINFDRNFAECPYFKQMNLQKDEDVSVSISCDERRYCVDLSTTECTLASTACVIDSETKKCTTETTTVVTSPSLSIVGNVTYDTKDDSKLTEVQDAMTETIKELVGADVKVTVFVEWKEVISRRRDVKYVMVITVIFDCDAPEDIPAAQGALTNVTTEIVTGTKFEAVSEAVGITEVEVVTEDPSTRPVDRSVNTAKDYVGSGPVAAVVAICFVLVVIIIAEIAAIVGALRTMKTPGANNENVKYIEGDGEEEEEEEDDDDEEEESEEKKEEEDEEEKKEDKEDEIEDSEEEEGESSDEEEEEKEEKKEEEKEEEKKEEEKKTESKSSSEEEEEEESEESEESSSESSESSSSSKK